MSLGMSPLAALSAAAWIVWRWVSRGDVVLVIRARVGDLVVLERLVFFVELWHPQSLCFRHCVARRPEAFGCHDHGRPQMCVRGTGTLR